MTCSQFHPPKTRSSFSSLVLVVSILTLSLVSVDYSKAGPHAKMKTGQGKEMTLTLKNLPNSRDYLYCELVIQYGDIGSDIYSTSLIKECSVD